MTRTGLECWLDPHTSELLPRSARIGLLSHSASVDGSGRHVLERIRESGRYRIETLFAPEHGLYGHEQDMEGVAGASDPATGLRIVSLYGSDAASLRPKPEQLSGLDAIVCDLQDVGSRYYTYVYTLSLVMEAARDAEVPVVVLDRPNPIGGLCVEGPVLDPSLASFVGRFPVPVRHGMTIAELALLFNEDFGIGCDLRPVRMEGWRRAMLARDTELPWVPPSPNMPTPETAMVYPGGCLIEGTNLSEGRGTTTPFELVGAPWLEASRLAENLRREQLDGVIFRAASFRPMFQKHAGRGCGGVQVIVTDASRFRPFETYLVLLRESIRLAPQTFDWRAEAYEFEKERAAIDLLLGQAELRPMLEAMAPLPEMQERWQDDLAEFVEKRKRHLLYE